MGRQETYKKIKYIRKDYNGVDSKEGELGKFSGTMDSCPVAL